MSGALLSAQVRELGEAAVQRNFGGQALVLMADAGDQLGVPTQNLPPDFDASVATLGNFNRQAVDVIMIAGHQRRHKCIRIVSLKICRPI